MADETLLGRLEPGDLHVMTFNIRRRTNAVALRRADRWTIRANRVRGLLRRERPTILGVQEALPQQASVIAESLGDGYRRLGHGRRADGNGEGCPIFFDSDRLELVDWEQTALSDTPSVPGSRSWGNLIPRVAVVARFIDRTTSLRVRVVNTHLDPFSPRSGVRSAVEVRRIALREGEPTIVTGDLNARPGSPAVKTLLTDAGLADAWRIAERRLTPEWNTFADYRAPRVGAGRIDWIMVTPGVEVRRIGINPHTVEGGWPSDHLPVQAIVRVGGRPR